MENSCTVESGSFDIEKHFTPLFKLLVSTYFTFKFHTYSY